MKMFLKLITILSAVSVVAAVATETTTTATPITNPLKNWYQVDVIVFNYNDFSLDDITPRILPLEKKFSGNKIVSLNSSEHPLNVLQNQAVVVNDDSITNKVIDTEETATVTVHHEINSLTSNQDTEEIIQDDALLTSGVSVTSEFAAQVNVAEATTKIASVISNPSIQKNIDTSNLDNTNTLLTNIQPHDISPIMQSSNSIENTESNNEDIIISQSLEDNLETTDKQQQLSMQIQQNIIKQQKIDEMLNTTPFIELPNSRYKLTDKMNKLTTDDNVNLLSYHCFNLAIENASSVVLESQKITKFKAFSGKLNFKKNNQGKIIVKSDFCFNIAANEVQRLKKQQNKLTEYSNKVNKKLYNYFSYEAQNSIKTSGNLMYIDSPILGLLIKITPINLEIDNKLNDK